MRKILLPFFVSITGDKDWRSITFGYIQMQLVITLKTLRYREVKCTCEIPV